MARQGFLRAVRWLQVVALVACARVARSFRIAAVEPRVLVRGRVSDVTYLRSAGLFRECVSHLHG